MALVIAHGSSSVRKWRKATEQALEETAERLAQIISLRRDIADAGLDLQAVMQLAIERSQELTGADGAMINLIEGDDMVVRAAGGIAMPVLGNRRPATGGRPRPPSSASPWSRAGRCSSRTPPPIPASTRSCRAASASARSSAFPSSGRAA